MGDKGGAWGQKSQKMGDVIYGRPLKIHTYLPVRQIFVIGLLNFFILIVENIYC